MTTKEIIALLNKDLADELAAVIQYTWQHWVAEGMESPAIIELFEETARDEMKHMELLGERIVYLGGKPTVQPSPVKLSEKLRDMVQDNLADENEAIKQYKEHIKACADDPATRLMLEKILTDEEKHADRWETVLGVRK